MSTLKKRPILHTDWGNLCFVACRGCVRAVRYLECKLHLDVVEYGILFCSVGLIAYMIISMHAGYDLFRGVPLYAEQVFFSRYGIKTTSLFKALMTLPIGLLFLLGGLFLYRLDGGKLAKYDVEQERGERASL